jgi:predicted phosphodiesterase
MTTSYPIAGSPDNIGIMADSHGRVGTLTTGIDLLKSLGCRLLYHLGDICDTAQPETADKCTRIIQDNGILAVKGNNEHSLAINYAGQPDNRISGSVAEFLGGLPLVRTHPGAIMAHSLPFEKELGLSTMVRIVEPAAAEFYFSQYPGEILFRGHSHTPEIIYKDTNKTLVTEPLGIGKAIDLKECRPCIVTCGALMDNLCLIWNTKEDWIVVLTI